MSAPCPNTAGAVASQTPTAGLSLAEVIRAGLPLYQKAHILLPQQWKVVRAILACRTPALGAHCYRCADCGRQHVQLHSCRNRHCPQCQGSLAAAWLDRQQSALLPAPYFHLVFTLPHCLNPLIRQNRTALYRLLFDSAAQTLLEFGRRRFAGQIGVTAVLHTWGQTLTDHYHLHCIVTGGAVSNGVWRGASSHYLFPVRALSKVFRGKFCSGLEALADAGALELEGKLQPLENNSAGKLLRQAARTNWVVYAKRPFAGPVQVLKYLSLYTHRVAISERRLLCLNTAEATLSFSYKDYSEGAQRKVMTLPLEEFVRRFLLHLLPERFVKIRHYGLVGNHRREERIQSVRALLDTQPASASAAAWAAPLHLQARLLLIKLLARGAIDQPGLRCPSCGSYRLKLMAIIEPPRRAALLDSS